MSALQRGTALLFDVGRPDLAEPELRRALAENPEYGYAHTLLAHCLGRQHKDEEAAKAIEEALRLSPDYSYAFRIRVWLLARRQRYAEAEADYREALRLDPRDDEYTYAGLSYVLVRQNRRAAALRAADNGLAIFPESVECLNRRAEALLTLELYQEAHATVANALRLDPLRGWTHAVQGWIWEKQGRRFKALRCYRQALALDPVDDWTSGRVWEIITKPVHTIILGTALLMLLAVFFVGQSIPEQEVPLTEQSGLRVTAQLAMMGWWTCFVATQASHGLTLASLTPFGRLLAPPWTLRRARRVSLLAAALALFAVSPFSGWLSGQAAFYVMVFLFLIGFPVLLVLPGARVESRLSRDILVGFFIVCSLTVLFLFGLKINAVYRDLALVWTNLIFGLTVLVLLSLGASRLDKRSN